VLFLAAGIRKAQVNEFDLVVLDHFQHIGDSHATSPQKRKMD
jgi:hypothetical protein